MSAIVWPPCHTEQPIASLNLDSMLAAPCCIPGGLTSTGELARPGDLVVKVESGHADFDLHSDKQANLTVELVRLSVFACCEEG